MSKDPSSRPKGVPTRYKAQRLKRRRRSVMTDSGRQLVSTIPVDSDGILKWDHFHWFPYEIIFPSIYGSSKTESVYDLGVQFNADCSWTPKRTRSRLGLDLHLYSGTLAGPPHLQALLYVSPGPLLGS